MPLKEIDLEKVHYYDLNNEVNIPKQNTIQVEKDKEARDAFLKENVEPNRLRFSSLKERFDWLVKNNFVESQLVKKYDFTFIEKLYDFLDAVHFQFQSFMAAYKFYTQYAIKTDDGNYYVESYEDRITVNALYYADCDQKLAMRIADEMIHQRFQPATPSFLNAGRARRGELVSCFVLQTTDDMNSIGRVINSAMQLSKIGGGVGINLSNVREAGASVMGLANMAGGVVPIMKLMEDAFTYSSQAGARQGAGVAYLSVFHPDVMSFLSTKKENADEKIRVKTLSLGLTVPDKFYELTEKGKQMALFSPADVEKVYGVPFNYVDLTKEYDNMVANDEIKKQWVDARNLEMEISKLQQESGYPFVINLDIVNRANPVYGKVVTSNLCSEILQTQTISRINNEQEYTQLGADISCNLGSINIDNMMHTADFGKSVETMTRALTFVSESSDISVVPSVQNGNRQKHAIGLGAMGLAAFLAKNKIYYGDEVALDFVNTFFLMTNYYTLLASNQIAKERGESFFEFEKSDYANGKYFDKYLVKDWGPKTDKVKKLFSDYHVPTIEDWQRLKEMVAKYGLYNAYRQAVAPTGSISYVNDTTASLQPIVSRVEARAEGMTGRVFYPANGLSNETLPYYVSAYDLDQRKVIDTYAAAQEHVDQGLAMTLFMRSTIPEGIYDWKDGDTDKMTTRDLTILRHYAYHQGIKSIYYIRTFTDDNTEQGVNECESCSI
ncbi:class 1b ribonucleoside-diphosphate reductase subunit alpha [Oenococcus oeni]|uniref:class 1b ribonucleoside-diphosphate reductase subunit alpha n=1 Tax=Oenococcus oeni TaxID=1247 RepID=UPI000277B191|nr:class 1b ribonucleoside-diphosphate reductase subunit alpha [Oenococcus oeni]EJO02913.1 ribonucleotide-diphosphate reductase subunit alpha [Oenococcus oeni AWRIB318]